MIDAIPGLMKNARWIQASIDLHGSEDKFLEDAKRLVEAGDIGPKDTQVALGMIEAVKGLADDEQKKEATLLLAQLLVLTHEKR